MKSTILFVLEVINTFNYLIAKNSIKLIFTWLVKKFTLYRHCLLITAQGTNQQEVTIPSLFHTFSLFEQIQHLHDSKLRKYNTFL